MYIRQGASNIVKSPWYSSSIMVAASTSWALCLELFSKRFECLERRQNYLFDQPRSFVGQARIIQRSSSWNRKQDKKAVIPKGTVLILCLMAYIKWIRIFKIIFCSSCPTNCPIPLSGYGSPCTLNWYFDLLTSRTLARLWRRARSSFLAFLQSIVLVI